MRRMSQERLEAEFQRATSLRDRGRLAEARTVLEHLAIEHPREFAVWLVLGGVQWSLEDLRAAEQSFSIATHMRPRSELASLSLFHVLKDLGRIDEAFGEMRRFLALRPESREYELLREEIAVDGIG